MQSPGRTKNRPEAEDQAPPLCYGDLILLSCTVGSQGTAYLCEEGCVIRDPEVEMKANSRDLTFEVCVAQDSRALHEINAMLRKYNIAATEKPSTLLNFHFSPSDSLHFERLLKARETEENAAETYSIHMKGRPVTFGDLIQLRHTKRQAFLGIDVSQAPKVESSCKKVVLSSALNASVRFQILPRFRYLSEGNTVCIGDNISLVSADNPFEYLHTSPGFATEDIGIVYEVNLSKDASTIWRVECFFSCNAQSENCIRTGDVVRLYHAFRDGFVSALSTKDKVGFERSEASSSLSSTMWVVEDENTITGGRLRTLRCFTLMHLVTKRYLAVSGDVLDPSIPASSRVSLSDKDKDNYFCSVTLEKSANDASNLLLHSPEESDVSANVCWGGRFRMVHASSSQYLHITDANRLAAFVNPTRASPTVDRADGLVLVASPALFREDSFELRKVPEEQVKAVETLSRMLPVLRDYRDSVEEAIKHKGVDFPSERVVEIVEQLESLITFVYTGSSEAMISGALKEDSALNPIPFCQNFMRDLCVADLLMDIVRQICNLIRKQKYLESGGTDSSEITQLLSKITIAELVQPERMLELPKNRSAMLICERVYDALLHMVRKHKQNATYLARYLDDIQEQLTLKVGAEKVLLEMLHENDVLLSPDGRGVGQSPFKKRHIKFHIDALIRDGKDPMHLEFLSSMVAIGDRGIEQHQDLVLPELIKYKADIVLDIQVKNQAVQLRDPRKGDAENQWTDLSIIATGASRQGVRGASLKQMLEYWQEYLLLLATLCKPDRMGRRDFLVRKVQSLVQCDICVTCLHDDSLPNHLRWTVCELLRVAFVEQDDFMRVARSARVAIWNDLDKVTDAAYSQLESEDVASETSEETNKAILSPRSHVFSRAQSTDLKKTVMEYFAKQAVHYYPPRVEYANRLKMSMARLCRQLVLFGHFHFSEFEAVMKIAHSILDFSNLRIDDAEQALLAGALQRNSELSKDATSPIPTAGSNAALKSDLSEQTITSALRQVRILAGEFPPLEVARLQCTFCAYKFEVGDIVVNQGQNQDCMFVIQSGSAFTVKILDGIESVVGTLGPGQIFGAEALTDIKPVWPWQIRCSSRLLVLGVPRADYKSTKERLIRNGPTKITDGLINIFNLQRESCLIINDIYDLRLQVRARRLLQEYRFDVNISNRKYCAAELVTQTSSVLGQFPMKSALDEVEIEDHFRIGSCLVFGPLSHYILPLKRCCGGIFRIDHGVVVIAVVQVTASILICVSLLMRVASGSTSMLHPGPSNPLGAVLFNLAMTGLWGLFNLLEIWGALKLHKATTHLCFAVQGVYILFFLINTSTALALGILADGDNSSNESVSVQSAWLAILTPIGLYSALAFASLATYVENPSCFVKPGDAAMPVFDLTPIQPVPHQKFLKALEFFDLDQEGMFSRTLTDLFVSRFRSLVVDAFCLLVRTHDSIFELYQELTGTLLLTEENSRELYRKANELTHRLLDATNALQAYNVDSSCKARADVAAELLGEILLLIDDNAPIIQRRLFQRLGLHRIVLRLLASLREEQMMLEGSLCYSILAGLCDENHLVKCDSAESMDIFMQHYDALPRMVVMLLTSIFFENSDLCEIVEESVIERIVMSLKSDLDECYLTLLRIVTAPKEQEPPIRRNQNLIMKFLGSETASMIHIMHLRKACSSKKGNERWQKNRAIYVALLELLSVCMAENNVDAKKRCRGSNPHISLTMSEIEEQLKDRYIPNRVKMSLLGFMDEAYIKVEFTARSYLLQPELCRVFDFYSRHMQMLPFDSAGSKLALLSESERELLMVKYLKVMHSFVCSLSASDFHSPTSPHTRVAIHLLETFSILILNGSGESGRVLCTPEEELRVLQVVQALSERLEPHSHQRYTCLKTSVEELLGSRDPNERGMHQREKTLRHNLADETSCRQSQALDVASGVKAFADEFLQQTAGASNERDAAQTVSTKLLDSLRQLEVNQDPSSLERMKPAFSDMCMESLVDLLEAAVTVPKFLPVKLCMTGLYILLKVVQSAPLSVSDTSLADEVKNRKSWLESGIPQVVIKGVSAQNVMDVIASECISIGVMLLERGKLAHQESFYRLLQGQSGAIFFGALRDRLLRAERGLQAYQSLFWTKAQELAIECEAQSRVLTISGVGQVCNSDRSSKHFIGSCAWQVLRLLQLFCEGHNRQMQDYIRYQGQNSADLVSCTADFLVATSREMHPVGVNLVLQCIDTLIEFVQNPCPANQRSLVDSQLPYVLNHLLQASSSLFDQTIVFEDMDEFQRQTEQVKTKTVTLLLSLLERVDGPFIPSRILEALEIDNIIREMNNLKDQYLPLCSEDEKENLVAGRELSENGSFKVACSLFMLLLTLRHYDTDGRYRIAERCSRSFLVDMIRLRANCGFVEIARDGQLERIFFQIPAVCKFLTSEAKENIRLSSAEANNHQDKMLYFVCQAHARYEEMVHLQGLTDSLLYRTYTSISSPIEKLFFFNALVLNILFIGGYRYPDLEWDTFSSMQNIVLPDAWRWGILVLSIFQLVLALIRLAGYYVDQGVLEVRRKFNTERYIHVYTDLYGGPHFYCLFAYFLCLDARILILFTFVLTNVLALALYSLTQLSFLFLGVHLLDMFHHSSALSDVLKAVTSRANTLLQTGGLAFIMMYVYGTVGFLSFPDSFLFDNPGHGKFHLKLLCSLLTFIWTDVVDGYRSTYNVNGARCDTLWKCFLVTVDMGLRKGDLGGALDDIQWRDLLPSASESRCDGIPGLEWLGCMGLGGEDTGSFIYFRIAYTSSFFVFVHTIVINILFGVIIDRFGDLRQQDEKMQEEIQNFCFVCGLDRYLFEVASVDGKGFERHTREDHNMWSYLFFIIHLYLKDINEHTGFESYVFSKIHELDSEAEIRFKKTPDVSWFPNGHALAIQSSKDAHHDTKLGSQVDQLHNEGITLAEQILARLQTATFALERSRATRSSMLLALEEESEGTQTSESEDWDATNAAGPNNRGRAVLAQGPLSSFSIRNVAPLVAVPGVANLVATAATMQEGMMEAAQLFAEMAGLGGVDEDEEDNESRLSEGAESMDDLTDPNRYNTQLRKLAEEGFDNKALNQELLERYNGDYQRVLRELFDAGAVPRRT